jgi:hypothetical protein
LFATVVTAPVTAFSDFLTQPGFFIAKAGEAVRANAIADAKIQPYFNLFVISIKPTI